MTLSLKTTSYAAAIVITVILSIILLLGSQQYRSYKDYEKIIEQNEKIIFQFATIREHITESLLEGRHSQLADITKDIEGLNANISRILLEPLIPDEYRISFVGQVDMAGITLLLRSIGGGDENPAKIRQLNQEVRILGERLMLFDRVIVNHVKRRLVGFQSVVIGILAIMVFVIISVLLFWHRQIAVPLFSLIKQAKQVARGQARELIPVRSTGEVAELTASFSEILAKHHITADHAARHGKILAIAHKAAEATRNASLRDAVFSETCKAILTNEDYCLAWIGIPGEGGKLLPIIADASTTMSRMECEECMSALLSFADKKGPEADTARKAAKTGKIVIMLDILADLPKGPFKNTPMAAGYANAISLPLIYDQSTLGILTIYSTSPHSFTEEETALLNTIANELGLALYALKAGKDLNHAAELNRQLTSAAAVMQATLSANGEILSSNTRMEKVTGYTAKELSGMQWLSLIPQENRQEHEQALTKSSPFDIDETNDREMTLLDKKGNVRIIRYRYVTPDDNQNAESSATWIGIDVTAQKALESYTVKTTKLAAIGELAVSVAHEINNQSNVLINYAQILKEETEKASGDNSYQIELLDNVLDEGELIADIAQQLLSFNMDRSELVESVQIKKVVEDAISLLKHQLKHDTIQVKADLPDTLPPLRLNIQKMQHVFLNLLRNARQAVNSRYPGQNENKRIEIKGETCIIGEKQWVRICFTDQGIGIQPNILNKVFDPFFSTKPEGEGSGLGLSISQSLVKDHKGRIQIESIPNDHTTVSVEIPLS